MSNPTRRTCVECNCELNFNCDSIKINHMFNASRCAQIVSEISTQETSMETGKRQDK